MGSTIDAPMQLLTLTGIFKALICLTIFGTLVLLGEYLKRKKYIGGELARKFAHTTEVTWAALWPLFLDLHSIAVLAMILTAGAILFRKLTPFKSIYSIKRLSIGEILIGIGLSVAAWFALSGSVYTAAVLIISWSDSIAAIVGTRYGKKNSIRILGATKSFIGSTAFFVTTIGVLAGYFIYEQDAFLQTGTFEMIASLVLAVGIAFALTIVELFGIYGIDNLSIPIVAVILLNIA